MTGLSAAYYNSLDLTGTPISRVDGSVNFDWGGGSPAVGINVDGFSARWTGKIIAVESGQYTFRTYSDDGVRLWVNGKLIIDHWNDHSPAYDTGTINLVAGQAYSIRLEYYEKTGGASVALQWKRPGQTSFVVVPRSQLRAAAR